MLLDNGADVNATDDDGDTALMRVINCDEEDNRPWYQVEYDIIEIVEKLLNQDGIDVNVENKNGKTALDIAEETGCTKKIQKLIIKHKTALIIPKGLKRQEERKILAAVMSEKDVGNRGDGTMHDDLRHKIGEYLGGGKRKTRSKRHSGGIKETHNKKQAVHKRDRLTETEKIIKNELISVIKNPDGRPIRSFRSLMKVPGLATDYLEKRNKKKVTRYVY